MTQAPPQPRPKHRSRMGAGQWLLGVLLVLLQAATPFAHAMLHASTAQAAGAQASRGNDRVWSPVCNSTSPEEKPCPLCAADHLPALPKRAADAISLATAQAARSSLPVSTRCSKPLDLFCRPPPSL